MSMGHGAFGGRGRCFTFWEDFSACLQKFGSESPKCANFNEDYHECLHHEKKVSFFCFVIHHVVCSNLSD